MIFPVLALKLCFAHEFLQLFVSHVKYCTWTIQINKRTRLNKSELSLSKLPKY